MSRSCKYHKREGQAPGMLRVRDWLDHDRMDNDTRDLVAKFIDRIETQTRLLNAEPLLFA